MAGHSDLYGAGDGQEESGGNEIRIVVVGRTGSGKSWLGNNILQKQAFHSAYSPESLTDRCFQSNSKVNNTIINLVDTPGFFHTRLQRDEIKNEIKKSLDLTDPGPHVFLYVCGIGRYSKEEINSLNEFVKIFGETVLKYTIMIFVGKDSLQGGTIEEYIAALPKEFKEFYHKAGKRCVAINSQVDSLEGKKKVDESFRIMKIMSETNDPAYYTMAIQKPKHTFLSWIYMYKKVSVRIALPIVSAAIVFAGIYGMCRLWKAVIYEALRACTFHFLY